MTYNKEEILKMLSNAPIDINLTFHSNKNNIFMKSLGNDFKEHYYYEYGATKFVLIPLDIDKDYVIKIPYTGSYYEYDDSYYNSQHDFLIKEDYYDFIAGEYEDRPWDYCAIEVQRYHKAAALGLANCFAKIDFIGCINDYPIYVQEKCSTFSSCRTKHSYSKEERIKTLKCCKEDHPFWIDDNWLTDFRFYYGEEMLINFSYWIHKLKWDDDLRSENIGYIKNKPVLIDYAGFLE